jgi:hypothetical protein
VDISYTPSERDALDKYSFSKSNAFDYYGPGPIKGLYDFLEKYNTVQVASLIGNKIHHLVDTYMGTVDDSNKYYWFTLREHAPSSAFDLPRWHVDGKYFRNQPELHYKFLVVMKGPGTLYFDTDAPHEYYESLSFEDRDRRALATKFADTPFKQLGNDQGVIYRVGKNGLIHSEPKNDAPRLMFFVLTGTKEQIDELKATYA